MLNIEFAPICLTVVSPAVVEVGELRVVRQVESAAADPTVSHMVTPVPPGHQSSVIEKKWEFRGAFRIYLRSKFCQTIETSYASSKSY